MLEELKRQLSWKVLIIIATVVGLGAVVTYLLTYLSTDILIRGNYIQGLMALGASQKAILRKTLVVYSVAAVLVVTTLVVLLVFYSHRIAGPTVRLGRFARKVASGDLTERVTLRKRDLLKPVAEQMNGICDTYSGRLNDLRHKLDEIEALAMTMANSGEVSRKDLEELAKKTKALIEELRQVRT